MSRSLEYANVCLDTGYLTSTTGVNIPTVRTYNINLKQILGDLYDEYDTFSICLNSVVNYSMVSSYVTSVGVVSSNVVVKVGMTGLNWMSSTMNGENSSLQLFPNGMVIGGGLTADDGGFGTANFNKPNCILFKKPPEPNVTLTVGLYFVRLNGPVLVGNSTGQIRHQCNYNFSIYGIK